MRDARVAVVVLILVGLAFGANVLAAETEDPPAWLLPAVSTAAAGEEVAEQEDPFSKGLLCTPPPNCLNPEAFCICIIRLLRPTCLVFNCNE